MRYGIIDIQIVTKVGQMLTKLVIPVTGVRLMLAGVHGDWLILSSLFTVSAEKLEDGALHNQILTDQI